MKTTPILQTFLFLCSTPIISLAADPAVSVEKNQDGGFVVKADGKPFTTYVVNEANKPYLWPVFGPTGKHMTRAYPMQNVEGEKQDHPHHRGVNYGHESTGFPGWETTAASGKVTGGGQTWAELKTFKEGAKPIALLGSIKHIEYKEIRASGSEAVVMDVCEHLDPNGKRFMTEERRMVFKATADARIIDWDQDFIATDGDVRFDDRKDAGLSIRVPTSMSVDTKLGGRIITSEGLKDADAWSKAAKWVDYNGPVEGEHLGVAMFNHPSSLRYPTRWHVRTYGLFTANPFAQKQFNKDEAEAPVDLKKGERIKLRHRFLLHKGDEKNARIQEAFDAYARETK
jgi:hypothetical protein